MGVRPAKSHRAGNHEDHASPAQRYRGIVTLTAGLNKQNDACYQQDDADQQHANARQMPGPALGNLLDVESRALVD